MGRLICDKTHFIVVGFGKDKILSILATNALMVQKYLLIDW